MPAFQAGDNLPQMLWSSTAATAHEAEAELADKLLQGVSKLDRLKRVDRTISSQLRQASVRHATYADLSMPGKVPQVLTHFRRSGCAVQTYQVDAERLQRGKRGTDLGAEQHRPRGLDCHMHDRWEVATRVGQGPFGAERCCLGLQQIL